MSDLDDFGSWPELARAFRAVEDRIDEALRRRNDLCLTWFEVLAELDACDGPARVSALATRVTISQPRVSRVLAAMAERGLVDRAAVADDGRGTQVRMTAQGHADFAAAADTYREVLSESLLARLTDAEIRVLRAIGRKIGEDARPPDGVSFRRQAVHAGPGCPPDC